MAVRVTLFVVVVLIFGISQVSSYSKIKDEEEDHVFTRGVNKRQTQDIVLRLSDNLNLGGSLTLVPAPAPISGQLDCGGLCKGRCSLNSRPNTCIRACGTCCFRCKCVPPGTFGNRELCGKCYTDITTHRNKTKCP